MGLKAGEWMKRVNESVFFPLRYSKLLQLICPMIRTGDRVLDIGAANGALASLIGRERPVDMTAIDRNVQPGALLPVMQHDGKDLGFEDDSFDCVLLIDVLHHDRNPRAILKEAIRVSRRSVIIKDHYWKNRFDHMLLRISDFLGNKCYGIALPYNFLTLEQWDRLFAECGLYVAAFQVYSNHMLDICNNALFELRK